MKVIKFGGASLKNITSLKRIIELVKKEKEPKVLVLSAFGGVTNKLQEFVDNYGSSSNTQRERNIHRLVDYLKKRHQSFFQIKNINGVSLDAVAYESIKNNINKLERLLYGVVYTEDLTDKARDLILSFGERFAVKICEAIFNIQGVSSRSLEADQIGIATDGDYGNATANLKLTSNNLQKKLLPILKKGITPVVTGFFGCDNEGNTTVFGRGGSDYSAAVISYALNAKELVIWKDVDGFMTADPKMVPRARRINNLSYDEAAELAYFGAKILHPRTIEPLKLKNIPLVICNIFGTQKNTTYVSKSAGSKKIVKGVAFDKNIAVIKIHGAGVGYKPGVLQKIVSYITQAGVNIKSVITSQTCINILISQDDLSKSFRSINKIAIKTVEKVEPVKDIALIGIVTEGLIKKRGLAARSFSAVAKAGVNVEMISAGASSVAYYFIVKEKFLVKTVKLIHKEFFN